jgi:hypothetical protein
MSITIKACDRCGNEVIMQEIHITWIPENHAHSWLCNRCYENEKVKQGREPKTA